MKVTSLYRRLKTPHNYQFVYITGCCRGTIRQVIMVMKHVKDVLLDRNGRTRCYKCLLCLRSFSSYKLLHHHVSYRHHIPRKTAFCVPCNKTFKSLPRLMVHTLYYCEARPKCLRYLTPELF